MNAYVFGTGKHSALADCHKSVLQSRFTALWGSGNIQFHGDETAAFTPEDSALLITGNLPSTPEGFEDVVLYVRAMRWFSDSLAGVGLAAPADFSDAQWQDHISTLNSLKIVTVPDIKSADILRRSGIQTAISTCADLAYLLPLTPAIGQDDHKRPVLGVLAENNDEISRELIALESDFEIRYVSPGDFAGIDICLTTQHQGVVLSVLSEIPFVAIHQRHDMIARECRALGYPSISDVRAAWSERVSLRELIHAIKPVRVRRAERNIELLQAALSQASTGKMKTVPIARGLPTLLVWAAADEYWDEAKTLLDRIGSGFDCLVPSDSRVSPAGCRKRLALPAGTLMHWAMLPGELKEQVENRYENVVVCHAYASNTKTHLADLAARTGRQGWEYRLWTHSCESYS